MKTSRITIKSSNLTLAYMGILVSMIVLYLYFLNMSVVHVVMRTQYEQEQNKFNAEIALLESSYIEAQHKIASRISSLEGYSRDIPKIFVSREGESLVLGNN